MTKNEWPKKYNWVVPCQKVSGFLELTARYGLSEINVVANPGERVSQGSGDNTVVNVGEVGVEIVCQQERNDDYWTLTHQLVSFLVG